MEQVEGVHVVRAHMFPRDPISMKSMKPWVGLPIGVQLAEQLGLAPSARSAMARRPCQIAWANGASPGGQRRCRRARTGLRRHVDEGTKGGLSCQGGEGHVVVGDVAGVDGRDASE